MSERGGAVGEREINGKANSRPKCVEGRCLLWSIVQRGRSDVASLCDVPERIASCDLSTVGDRWHKRGGRYDAFGGQRRKWTSKTRWVTGNSRVHTSGKQRAQPLHYVRLYTQGALPSFTFATPTTQLPRCFFSRTPFTMSTSNKTVKSVPPFHFVSVCFPT